MTTETVNIIDIDSKTKEEEAEDKVQGSDGFESYFDRMKKLNDDKKKKLEVERLKANRSVLKSYNIKTE